MCCSELQLYYTVLDVKLLQSQSKGLWWPAIVFLAISDLAV